MWPFKSGVCLYPLHFFLLACASYARLWQSNLSLKSSVPGSGEFNP